MRLWNKFHLFLVSLFIYKRQKPENLLMVEQTRFQGLLSFKLSLQTRRLLYLVILLLHIYYTRRQPAYYTTIHCIRMGSNVKPRLVTQEWILICNLTAIRYFVYACNHIGSSLQNYVVCSSNRMSLMNLAIRFGFT